MLKLQKVLNVSSKIADEPPFSQGKCEALYIYRWNQNETLASELSATLKLVLAFVPILGFPSWGLLFFFPLSGCISHSSNPLERFSSV